MELKSTSAILYVYNSFDTSESLEKSTLFFMIEYANVISLGFTIVDISVSPKLHNTTIGLTVDTFSLVFISTKEYSI